MQTYIAFLRGINVGGKALIKMAALQTCLAASGLEAVKTYIQSGNVVFEADVKNKAILAQQIANAISKTFKLEVSVVVFDRDEWQAVITEAPKWWGKDATWKHNILIMLDAQDTTAVLPAIGELKPAIEKLATGKGVVYQSISWDKFGQAASGKVAGKAIYKKMTVRNYNTATKLAVL